ncbi:MAG: carbonic anhydrase [Dehalococcoidia bacterium]
MEPDPSPDWTTSSRAALPDRSETISSDAALERLLEGNDRFVRFVRNLPGETPEQRTWHIENQQPFAGVVTCADSRVAPEIIFDTGLGDLVVVRVAGVIWDDIVVAGIEFAIEVLGVPLIVFVGHQGCGATSIAVTSIAQGVAAPGRMKATTEALRIPTRRVLAETPGANLDTVLFDRASKENVRYVIDRLQSENNLVARAVASGKVKLAGFFLSLETGKVQAIA